MDGTDLNTAARQSGSPYPDNVVIKQEWLETHPRDLIRQSQSRRLGYWYECVRDGRQIAEANDLGTLMRTLKRDFDTPESREP